MDFFLTAILQGLCFAGLATGIYLSMKIFNIPDITTDGSYTFGAAVTGVLLMKGWSAAAVLPVVMLSGALAGALTGLIHTKLKVNPLLAGILVMTGLYSVNLGIMGRSNIPLLNFKTVFDYLHITGQKISNDLFCLLLISGGLVLAIGYLLKTDYGLTMRATGNSERMIRALGVNTDHVKIAGLALANALTATSGYLMAQFQGFTDINMGVGIVIVGLGSVIIAETLNNWLRLKNIWLILLVVGGGAVMFQLALAFTLSIGVDPVYLKLTTAILVLMIVGIPGLRRKAIA